jgi:hypothetical protein
MTAAQNVNAQNVNVVGLFDNTERAAAVVQELTNRGFRRDQIELTTSQSIGSSNDLHGHITGLGAPPHEAQFWSQGVHSGGTLLNVHTSEDRTDEAMEILTAWARAACKTLRLPPPRQQGARPQASATQSRAKRSSRWWRSRSRWASGRSSAAACAF